MFISFIRGLTTLIVGSLVTLTMCLLGIVLGILQRILSLFGLETSFQIPIFGVWSIFIHELCLERMLGMETKISGRVRAIQKDEIVVCIANHPSTIASASLSWFVYHYLSRRMLVVSKIEHLGNIRGWIMERLRRVPRAQRRQSFGNPLGWCMNALNSAIFVDRNDPAQSERAIVSRMSNGVPTPCTLILLPDSGRPSMKVIQEDVKRFEGKFPDIASKLKRTRFPRVGAVHSTSEALRGKKVRWVDLTIKLLPVDWSIFDIFKQAKWVLRMDFREVTLPVEKNEQGEWLVQDWIGKNELIDIWEKE